MVERYIEYIAFFGVSSTKMAEPFYHFGRAKMLLGLLSSIKRRSNTTVDHCTRPLTVVNPTKPKITQQNPTKPKITQQSRARQSKTQQGKAKRDRLYSVGQLRQHKRKAKATLYMISASQKPPKNGRNRANRRIQKRGDTDYIEARKGAHSAFDVSHSKSSSQSGRD